MSAPRIAGARRVVDRYGAGVYRFPNGRGLSVSPDRQLGGWAVVEVMFIGPGHGAWDCARSTDGEMDLHRGLTCDELAALAAEVCRDGAA